MMSPEYSKNLAKEPVEIERKFLVNNLPDNLDSYEHDEIKQGYLVIGADGSEARLRDRGGEYTLTVKSKGDVSRGEWETIIDKAQFDLLWSATEGKRLEKTRYKIPHGDQLIELDIYEGELMGLVSVEVEFATEAEAAAFDAPEWFGYDITTEKVFKNQNLALGGLDLRT